ncbi:polysaccharide biosynthesis/export family protein [Spiribacter sp. 221]|uniref:polysaccharide biosynthesis/export family protein n=1 Tax=Spiribacter onubensis TaxID=3122420 RepID=UPI00349F2AF3
MKQRLPGLWQLIALVLALAMVTAVPAQQSDSGYELGSGDVISIQVFGEPDLSFSDIRLTGAGTVPFPFLGEVQALGRTRAELERTIEAQLRDGYLVNPEVTVNVIRYRDYYVTGEVRAPGAYPFEPGTTVRKAISRAGGFTDRASRSNIVIYDDERSQEADEGRDAEMETQINPGDILTVNESFF